MPATRREAGPTKIDDVSAHAVALNRFELGARAGEPMPQVRVKAVGARLAMIETHGWGTHST